jgi:hypothetical protein
MREAWAEIPEDEKPDWNPNYWHIVGGNNPTACGSAILRGSIGATYSGSGCGTKTTFHELGHNFGLPHARLIRDDGSIKTYGDHTSVMGGDQAYGLNVVDIHRLGLHRTEDVRTIESNSMFVACPHEMAHLMRKENETSINIISNGSGPTYFVSKRKTKGFPYKTTDGRLFIHHNDAGYSNLIDSLSVGESSTKIPGVKITFVKSENEAALVLAEFDGDSSTTVQDDILPEAFPTPDAQIELSTSHNGLWYNSKMYGQGFDLHVKNGKMNLYWYTFVDDITNVNSSDWFIAEANLTTGPEEFDIVATKGGRFSNPSEARPEVIGRGQLYFMDETNGVFNFNTEVHGKGSIPITSIIRTNGDMDGAYYNPDRNHEGFTFRFIDDRCIGYWYTYTEPNIYFKAKPKWYLLDGVRQDSGEYKLELFSASGSFIGYEEKANISSQGFVTLTPSDDETFTFESDIKNKVITSKLQKLF